MSILPPLLPELDGSRPAAASLGPAAATTRLGARVVAIVGADALVETRHGRALLQGAPPLRPGVALVLELQHAAPAPAQTGRLLGVGQQRLEPPLAVRLQLVSPTQPAATVRSAAPLEVSLRVIGADDRPSTPAFAARLVVPLPEPGPVASGSSATMASPAGGAVVRGGVSSGPSGRADAVLPANTAGAPVTSRPAAALAGPGAGSAGREATPTVLPSALPERTGILMAQRQGVEAVVLPRDVLGRTLLRAAGFTFQVETPVDLPVGARLQLTLPAELARPSAAPLQGGSLEVVRTLAALLRDRAGMAQPSQAGTLRLPEPDATLAARLLRLIQLIAPRAGDCNVPNTSDPAAPDGQPGAARIAAALAELGRLAGEPQSGGWRMLLLPLGFAGTPLLRLYVREDPGAEDGGGKERQADRERAARRAVFALEFSQLGRAQIDVLCHARRFDLLVRTEQPLPPHLRRQIRELYLAARDVAGVVGTVRFHAGRWVALPEPAGAGGPGGGITV